LALYCVVKQMRLYVRMTGHLQSVVELTERCYGKLHGRAGISTN
jgi:hypothetical protein